MCGPGVDNAVPHRFGGRGPMLNRRCLESVPRDRLVSSLFVAVGEHITQAARASAHGPLVCSRGAVA